MRRQVPPSQRICRGAVALLGFGVVTARTLPGTALAAHPVHRPERVRLREPVAPPGESAPTWCPPELRTVDEGICFFDGTRPNERRTLVIFLHGAINDASRWQWLQLRAMADDAKALGFAVLMPRAPLRAAPGTGYQGRAWNSSFAIDDAEERGHIDAWKKAETVAAAGHPWGERFVMGFSSGAYYTTSLALRGRVAADGYAVFAGGAAGRAPAAEVPAKPFFVGVCTRDQESVARAWGLAGSLTAWGWPHRADAQPVGHLFTRTHVAHALVYLRGEVDRRAK